MAPPTRTVTSPRDVVFLAYAGMQSLDVAGPLEVFAGANKWLSAAGSDARYRIHVAAGTPTIATESALTLARTVDLAERWPTVDTVIVPGGDGVVSAADDPVLVRWIEDMHALANRTASVCSGAFLLAAAGLLDGRRVTTHWARAEQLADRHPELTVDADPIHIVDGPIWTSAGVTAGIDLALAMVADDHGEECAQVCARWLVMFLRRPGGQSQFATPVWAESARHDGIRMAVDTVHANPGADCSVPALADKASMSERNFTRVFRREVGCPPGRYVEQVRVEAARRLLETSDLTVDAIAAHCGLGTSETLRRAFHRTLGTAPASYRRRFAHASTKEI